MKECRLYFLEIYKINSQTVARIKRCSFPVNLRAAFVFSHKRFKIAVNGFLVDKISDRAQVNVSV